ncbi:MAG TPA: glycosyltransferase family 4 protein [Polyangiales bacterium]|nr:glycosyltransferase family 4 protein [Polyangiales bacterium]
MSDSQRIDVLMLGWEYPPHISGGLGTACEGLTTALAPLGVHIDFVVPHLYGGEHAPHMHLTSPDVTLRALDPLAWPSNYAGDLGALGEPAQSDAPEAVKRAAATVAITRIPAFLSPYLRPEEYTTLIKALESGDDTVLRELLGPSAPRVAPSATSSDASSGGDRKGPHYGDDLFGEVMRYAERVAIWSSTHRPQVVHAHDWMTFPAATRVAHLHGIPMIAHVHSLEQDRSGAGANHTIVGIEGAGLRAATRVVAVSHYTARMINQLHGIPFDNIDVAHNGAYARKTVTAYREESHDDRPMVLFLGRITFQKGPDYFVEAAAKVLEQVPNARFVMAGNGDMLPRLQHRVHELGIADAFDFPGFVRGTDVERLFSTADAYVMPSVSEPFGISALEAMSYDTPVVLSRQSGASEILHHALKVDFWDVNRLAAQIVAILRYPELRNSIVDMAREEVRRVHWEAAATKVKRAYLRALGRY